MLKTAFSCQTKNSNFLSEIKVENEVSVSNSNLEKNDFHLTMKLYCGQKSEFQIFNTCKNVENNWLEIFSIIGSKIYSIIGSKISSIIGSKICSIIGFKNLFNNWFQKFIQ